MRYIFIISLLFFTLTSSSQQSRFRCYEYSQVPLSDSLEVFKQSEAVVIFDIGRKKLSIIDADFTNEFDLLDIQKYDIVDRILIIMQGVGKDGGKYTISLLAYTLEEYRNHPRKLAATLLIMNNENKAEYRLTVL